MIIKKHTKPKVIHCINYRKKIDTENIREQLLLYTSWRNEECDLYHGMSTYADAFELQKHITADKMKTYKPLSAILNMIAAEIEAEREAHYHDIAPATQHEESQYRLQHAKQSESLGFSDHDRPENQKYY